VLEDEKVKVKLVHVVEWRYHSTHPSALDGGERHRYALNRRLGGHHCWCGRSGEEKHLLPKPEFELRITQLQTRPIQLLYLTINIRK